MKSTLVCIHVMPREIEMFERFIIRYKHALQYLDENDDVTIKATLNLNPLLTDWDSSKLKQQYFIDKFNSHFHDVKNINDVTSAGTKSYVPPEIVILHKVNTFIKKKFNSHDKSDIINLKTLVIKTINNEMMKGLKKKNIHRTTNLLKKL